MMLMSLSDIPDYADEWWMDNINWWQIQFRFNARHGRLVQPGRIIEIRGLSQDCAWWPSND